LSGGPFHNQVLGFGTDLGIQLERVAFGIGELSGQYTPFGIALGLLGLALLWRYRRPEALLFTGMLLGNFFFAMNYALVGYLYFIPTYLLWALFMCVGAGWLARWAMAVVRLNWARVMLAVEVGAALAVVLIYTAALRYPNIDQSGQTSTRDIALALLNVAPRGASLYLDWEDLSVIRFYRLVYDMRTDLTLHTGDPADWPKGIYCDLQAGNAVYVGKFAGASPPYIAQDFALEPAPIGWRVTKVVNPAIYEVPPCGLCATCR
jgi:hypothetical protein